MHQTWTGDCFTYDNLHVSMPFPHIIPPLPSPTESKRLFYTFVSLLLLAYRVIITIFLNSIYMRQYTVLVFFSFSISPSKEHPGLISFRLDGWISLQFKSLLQHPSSKALVFRHSAFFTVQLSRPYMTTGKTIALTRRTFVQQNVVHWRREW